jgi:low molecular weight phosphotyrosine protein phosphatase
LDWRRHELVRRFQIKQHVRFRIILMSQTSSPRVLVVCLGNICRSPIGEAVLKNVAAKRGVDVYVDSAGTAGYHVGDDPDER